MTSVVIKDSFPKLGPPRNIILIPDVSLSKKEFAEDTGSENIAVRKRNRRFSYNQWNERYF